MAEAETKYEQFAALSGWLLLAGCFVAVNAAPSVAAKTTIALTLGLGGVAGWLQMFFWLSECSSQQAKYEESRLKHEEEVQQSREAEFRALGKEAPFWKYFGYMYISNDELRKECHEIMAARADRDASLIDYLGNDILASDATRYIAEFHPAPGPTLAPAFAQRSDLVVGQISEVNSGSDQISDRSYSDIKDIIGAATRIQKGGGDLAPQLKRWRTYLGGFKNTAELVAEIDKAMPRPNGHLTRRTLRLRFSIMEPTTTLRTVKKLTLVILTFLFIDIGAVQAQVRPASTPDVSNKALITKEKPNLASVSSSEAANLHKLADELLRLAQ